MFKLSSRFIATLLVMSSAAKATEIDGIRLGSPVTEAQAVMIKSHPALSAAELLSANGSSFGITTKSKEILIPPEGQSVQFAMLTNDEKKVWTVAKDQRFSAAENIKPEEVIAALKKQYGPPSNEGSSYIIGLNWQTSRDGKRYVGPSNNGPCGDIGYASSTIPGTSMFWPKGWIDPNCGETIVAHISLSQDGKVMRVYLQILDGLGMFKNLTPELQEASIARRASLDKEMCKKRGC